MPARGVVVLAYGDRSHRHFPLVQSLLEGGIAADDVVVVHNPETPGTVEGVPEFAGVRRLLTPRNLGYAAAMNLGFDHHRRRGAEAVAFVTHDVRLPPSGLDELFRFLEADPAVGLVGPATEQGFRRHTGGLFTKQGVADWIRSSRSGERWDVDWVDGSVVVVRTRAVSAAPFPPHYFMYGEDVFLGCSLRAAGWRVVVDGAVTASSEPGSLKRRATFGYLGSRNAVENARCFRGWQAAVHVAGSQVRNGVREGAIPTVTRVLGIAAAILRRFGEPPRLLLAIDRTDARRRHR